MSSTLAAALTAAERGWHVHPLRPGTKRPALHGRADCPATGICATEHQGWEQRSTTAPDRIRAAWDYQPRYNVGTATGPSGLCVLDLDRLKADETTDDIPARWKTAGALSGEDVLAILAEEAGQPLPGDTLTVRTPTGGLHLYYAVPAGAVLRSTAGERGNGLGWKIDTRAWGGYVVTPGSTTPDGRYEYLYDGPPALLPGWLVERLTPAPPPAAPVLPIRPARGRRSRYLDVAIRAEAGKVTDATTNRNATLFAAALALGQLVAGGAVSEQEIRAALMTAAGRHIGTRQFTEREAHTTITSGLKAGANRPRQIA
jgi:hypothetical protein